MSDVRHTVALDSIEILDFVGAQDANLRMLEEGFEGRLILRGQEIRIEGEAAEVQRMVGVVEAMVNWVRSGRPLDPSALARILEGAAIAPVEAQRRQVQFNSGRRGTVEPRTPGQALYLDAIGHHEVVFGVGPAGTGKTFLAVVMAVRALLAGEIDRIFLVRPAVEAGEQLGFLPGDLQDKVDPYLRPLYDALTDCLGSTKVARFLANGTIEVAPLAYMRGRTLNRAFVILDEGQNTTLTQMKMFLTRLGPGTRAVVTGDVTQIDLGDPRASGLVLVRQILQGVDGIAFVDFGEGDVVRHPLVRRIVAAFDDEGKSPR